MQAPSSFFEHLQFHPIYLIADWAVAITFCAMGIYGVVGVVPEGRSALLRSLDENTRWWLMRGTGGLFLLLGTAFVTDLVAKLAR